VQESYQVCSTVELGAAQRETTMADEQNSGLDGKKERAMAGRKRMVVNQQKGCSRYPLGWERAVVLFLILQD